jgi:hypothetical protein
MPGLVNSARDCGHEVVKTVAAATSTCGVGGAPELGERGYRLAGQADGRTPR